MMVYKEKFEDYTEAEFLDLLNAIYEERDDLSDDAFDNYIVKTILHFEVVTEHPKGMHAFFSPGERGKSTPEDVLKAVKEWRAANNKPGFKSE